MPKHRQRAATPQMAVSRRNQAIGRPTITSISGTAALGSHTSSLVGDDALASSSPRLLVFDPNSAVAARIEYFNGLLGPGESSARGAIAGQGLFYGLTVPVASKESRITDFAEEIANIVFSKCAWDAEEKHLGVGWMRRFRSIRRRELPKGGAEA